MSDSEELKRAVERLLRENNVILKEFIQPVLHRIAGLRAEKLITKGTAESMHVTGEDPFKLATKLMSACQTLVGRSPTFRGGRAPPN